MNVKTTLFVLSVFAFGMLSQGCLLAGLLPK
jgi:hypothetical protein